MAKSSSKKTKAKNNQAVAVSDIKLTEAGRATDDRPPGAVWEDITPRQWQIACLVILGVALLLRLYALNLKPFHHDEGVNGFFLTDLYRNGNYKYQPDNYHGPTLYFFSLAICAIGGVLFGKEAGLSDFAVRLTTVLFGVGSVGLIFLLRKHLGTIATLVAAALLAVSPGMVFISRYFIHEMLFVFFTIGMVVAAVKYYDAPAPDATKKEFGYWSAVSAALLAVFAYYATTRPASFKLLLACTLLNLAACLVTLHQYEGPRTMAFLFGVVCLALLFGTKETAFISVGVLLIAVAAAQIYLKFLHPAVTGAEPPLSAGKLSFPEWLKENGARLGLLTVVGLGVFLFVSILFYSSFFTYPDGLNAAIKAYDFWSKTGARDHNSPPYRYLEWLWNEEGALLVLAGLGVAIAFFWRRTKRFAVFAALWAVGITAAYSLIKYKTPWLAINFLPPLALAAGWGLGHIYGDGRDATKRNLALLLTGAALCVGVYQTWQLNFVHYDDDAYIYVYAHSKRQMNEMADKIKEAVKRSPTGKDTGIIIMSPEYWPLPWTFHNYPKAAFFGSVVDTPEPIIIGRVDQLNDLQAKFGANYKYYGVFDLRPGVQLILFIKNDIAP